MFQTFESTGGPEHVAERVKSLRTAMAAAKVDCFLVPRSDEHQGEYVPACAERLRWLTGFSGSAGLAAIARKSAVLFTDGRYAVQAKNEIDTAVLEISMLPRSRISDWLAGQLSKGQVIGFDPWLHTAGEINRLTTALSPTGIKLKPITRNLVDKIWGNQRPKPPLNRAIVQPAEFAGRTAHDKLSDLQKLLKAEGQHAVILTLPDSICWLFNIRGSDVAHNPVALAYAIVPVSGKAELFLDPAKVDHDLRAHVNSISKLYPRDRLVERVKHLKTQDKRVRLDPETAAYWFSSALGSKCLNRAVDPCILPKAIKNSAEITGSKAAHLRDGAAVAKFLAWLDEWAADGTLDEITAVKKLEDFRRETNALRDISFTTISGSGPNGAIVHYRVTEATNRKLLPGELFLIDSGGQYQDGTTDITRTVAVGTPDTEMCRYYTAVLKGHIAVATARFPKGTRGIDLDPFARRPLWDLGADYDHGTGHGIGSYLSVHEGPQSISRAGMAVLQPGMLLSNEPGYYRENAFGIRIENVVLVSHLSKGAGQDRETMHFETLTLAPFDRRLIDKTALSPQDIAWINSYHARVFNELAPLVDVQTRRWLSDATAELH